MSALMREPALPSHDAQAVELLGRADCIDHRMRQTELRLQAFLHLEAADAARDLAERERVAFRPSRREAEHGRVTLRTVVNKLRRRLRMALGRLDKRLARQEAAQSIRRYR